MLFFALLPWRALAEATWEINVVGDMYEDGRKVIRPTPEKPAYYFPIVTGFTEMGATQAGDPAPPRKQVVHDLATALAAEGYLVTSQVDVPAPANPGDRTGKSAPATVKAFAPPPSLILVFHWGALRAVTLPSALGADVQAATAPPEVVNKGQMIGLMAGKNFDSTVDFGDKTEKILQGIQNDRYFVMVSAYDFDAYNQQHKKVLLWVAKMSVPSAGNTMSAVMPALIKSGGPFFGRETTGPKTMDVPVLPDGKVEIGTPTVVEPKN
jgi:hypothetical protein